MSATLSAPALPKLGNTRVTGKEQFYTPDSTAYEVMAQVAQLVPDLAKRPLL